MKEQPASHGFTNLVRGLAVGAVTMYLLDPDKGRRRRAVARDKLRRFGNDALRLTQQATRDAGNRLHGVNASLQQRLTPQPPADELKLIERVRSVLGRCVSHPHAVHVGANGGTVVLSGPILTHEAPELLGAVRAVPGVIEVEDHLDYHASDDRLPSLQGESRRNQDRSVLETPAMRLGMLVGGATLVLYGLGKRGIGGLALASAGLGVAVRAVDQESANGLVNAARSAVGQTAAQASPHRGRDRSLREAGGGEAGMASPIGNDGTPAGASGAGERSTSSEIAAGARSTPLVGNDGTTSTSGDPRTSAGRAGDSQFPTTADGGSIANPNRPPL